MILPNLPTDNLYKFTFLAGLILLLFSIVLFVTQYNIILEKKYTLSLAIIKHKAEFSFLKEDLKTFKTESNILDEAIKTFDKAHFKTAKNFKTLSEVRKTKTEENKYFNFLFRFKNELESRTEKFNKLKIVLEKNLLTRRKIELESNLLDAKTDMLINEIKQIKYLLFFCTVLFITGSLLAFNGYNKWLNLVQLVADEKLALELKQLKDYGK